VAQEKEFLKPVGIPVAVVVDMIAYIVSLLYVGVSLLICFFLKKFFDDFVIRKLLHILMSCWWFIRLYFIDAHFLWTGPVIFLILTYVYSKIKKETKTGMGQFCFSLSVMTFITECFSSAIMPATAAIFAMGFADSAAALSGNVYQKYKKTQNSHSIVGTGVFFVVAFAVLIVCFKKEISIWFLLFISGFLSITEAYIFPKYDNITIPFITFVLTYFGSLI